LVDLWAWQWIRKEHSSLPMTFLIPSGGWPQLD